MVQAHRRAGEGLGHARPRRSSARPWTRAAPGAEPGRPEGERAAAAAPDAEDEGEPVVFTAPEHVQIQPRGAARGDPADGPRGPVHGRSRFKIAMPDWAGGGPNRWVRTTRNEKSWPGSYVKNRWSPRRRTRARGAGAAPRRPSTTTGSTSPRTRNSSSSTLARAHGARPQGHEFGWDKDPTRQVALCLPYDEYMKPITTSEEEAGYDLEVDPDWDNPPSSGAASCPGSGRWNLRSIRSTIPPEWRPARSFTSTGGRRGARAGGALGAPRCRARCLPNEPDYVTRRRVSAMPSGSLATRRAIRDRPRRAGPRAAAAARNIAA